jgi:hypothetical protein
VGPVADLGDGRYRFSVKASPGAQSERFLVRVTDVLPGAPTDVVTATLFPVLDVTIVDVRLYAHTDSLSASAGGSLGFVVNRADRPHAPYVLVARPRPPRLRGLADPGLGGGAPLVLLQRPFYPAGPLVLDGRGRAQSALVVAPHEFEPLIGRRLEVVGYVLSGGRPPEATNPVSIEVGP